jgi:hypothetical protein
MTLSTFFVESPSTSKCPSIISWRSRGNDLVMLEKQPSPKKKQQRGIQFLNKMQQDIIRITVQYADGSPIEPKGVLSKWRNDYGVVAREKFKIIWSWNDVSKDMQETLWRFIKEHYIFPSEQKQLGKNAMMKTISNAL